MIKFHGALIIANFMGQLNH